MVGNISPAKIVRLIDILAAAVGRSPSTVGRWASGGDGRMYGRLRRGHTITVRRAARTVQWLSDHWAVDAVWPPDIPRPTPSPDSPAARSESQAPETQIADPVAAVLDLRRRATDATGGDAPDWAEAARCQAEMMRIALRLDPATGRLASPAALCATLGGIPRHAYDDVVRRYAGRPGLQPRRGRWGQTPTARLVEALRQSGDVRFAPAPASPAAARAVEAIRQGGPHA